MPVSRLKIDYIPGPLLRQRYSSTAVGRLWLEKAPRLAAQYARDHELQLSRSLKSGHAFVLPARSKSGQDMLLKISRNTLTAKLEALALRYWPEWAPHVHHLDGRTGALLLERIRPGSQITDRRLATAADLLRKMQPITLAVPHNKKVPSLAEQVTRGQSLISYELWPGDAVRDAAISSLRQGPRRLLHGNFTPGSILISVEGAVMVSPRPAVGDPCYDAASWALSDQESGSVRHNCQQLAKRAEMDEERIREIAWIVAALELELAPDAYQARLRRWLDVAATDKAVKNLLST